MTLASVVTKSVLPEFMLLKFSVELYCGLGHHWFIRGDAAICDLLKGLDNVHVSAFSTGIDSRPDLPSPEFRKIVAEKMTAIAFAWDSGEEDRVAFLDSDLIVTNDDLMTHIWNSDVADLVLTPNYYPESMKRLEELHGIYNSGFVLTRNREFHRWWKDAFERDPTGFADQRCLNEAGEAFSVHALDERSNVGFWRSLEDGFRGEFRPIPQECSFLHVHMFQPVQKPRQVLDKAFALTAVSFLSTSPDSKHQKLLEQILAGDTSGLYELALTIPKFTAPSKVPWQDLVGALSGASLPGSVRNSVDVQLIRHMLGFSPD